MVKLVGILNVTPDSFSDGGLFLEPAKAIHQAEALFQVGAAIIDVGAESTRPNAVPLSETEEWQRLEPILSVLITKYPGRISLDSYHPATIEKAWAIGPIIVNDVTGLNNPAMVKLVKRLKPVVIISHAPGVDLQAAHRLMPVRDVETVKSDLLAKERMLLRGGLKSDQIILDPGIGFGKTLEINLQLLSFAAMVPSKTVMIGYSRKRFLGDQRMEIGPNLAAAKVAIGAGASYLRVHDVAGHHAYLASLGLI